MSRYSIPPQQPGLTVTVGWDNPLGTFFAQVFDPSIEEDADACLLWIGTAPAAIPTVAALQAQLTGWATIPPTIVDRLSRAPRSACAGARATAHGDGIAWLLAGVGAAHGGGPGGRRGHRAVRRPQAGLTCLCNSCRQQAGG